MKNLASIDRRERVRDLLASGLTIRQIANALNLSTQRVYQIKALLEQDGKAS